MNEIDEILANYPDLDEETIVDEDMRKNVKELRDEGELQHKSGNHDESIAKLTRALEMLKEEI